MTVSPGASLGTPGTHSYTYDALGRRVSKTTSGGGGTTTVFTYTGNQVIAEYTAGTAASNPDRKYVYCVTCYIDEPIALIDATGVSEVTYYYHRNRQFSIVGLTDSTGTVIERYAYTAYGETTVLDANGSADADNLSDVGNPYTYTGRRLDPETALHYFRARYHDAKLGRFLQRDPLGYPDGLNTYAGYFTFRQTLDPSGYAEVEISENLLDFNEYSLWEDLPAGNPSAGFDIDEVVLAIERRGEKCCVYIKSISWHGIVHMPSIELWEKKVQGLPVSMEVYHRNRDMFRGLSDAEWYNGKGFIHYGATVAHELAHIEQYRAVVPESLQQSAEEFNAKEDIVCKDSMEDAIKYKNQQDLFVDIRRSLLKIGATLDFRQAYPPGPGFEPDQYGEMEATQAEREILESEYQDWEKFNNLLEH